MCGIIGYISKNPKNKQAGQNIIEQYQNQWKRGTQGFGVVEIFKDAYNLHRSTEPTSALIELRLSKAPILMFHHRTPTSTDNTLNQTHPIKVSNNELIHDFLIMHNGMIRNNESLRKMHKDLGYTYTTLEISEYSNWKSEKFNDTESLAVELARFLDGKTTELNIVGSAAFLCLMIDKKTQKPTKIIWGKNEISPLEILETKHGLLIASTIPSTESHSIIDNSYFILDLAKLTKNPQKNILDLIITKELPIKKEAETSVTIYAHNHKPTILEESSHSNETPIKIISGKTNIKEKETSKTTPPGYTEREYAFFKMSNRISEKYLSKLQNLITDKTTQINKQFSEDIEAIFQNLAWANVSQGEIDIIISTLEMGYSNLITASDLNTIMADLDIAIREKMETARKHLRHMYDTKEEKQTDTELQTQGWKPNPQNNEIPTLVYPHIADADDIQGITTNISQDMLDY